MYVRLFAIGFILVSVFGCVRTGRWSDERAVIVFQDADWWRLLVITVMSGEVCCWFEACGNLVGVLVLRKMLFEFNTRDSMIFPLWSLMGENQAFEWALISPVIIEFGSRRIGLRQLLISWSSVWSFDLYMFDLVFCLYCLIVVLAHVTWIRWGVEWLHSMEDCVLRCFFIEKRFITCRTFFICGLWVCGLSWVCLWLCAI